MGSSSFDAELEDYLLSHAIARDQSEREYRGIYKLMYRVGNKKELVDKFDEIFLRELVKGIFISDKTFIDQFKGQNLIQLDLVEYMSSKVALRVELEAAEQKQGLRVKFLQYKE